ncbi:acyltransferase family protein [Spelaeicoccus albus]|uniref:Peptidoglycan/LPS O-acetylase OafA/YrhL n=1 Tax=Spelaeicoccus albus TaxID=1280376 RepID=A0A7Z0CZJ4_9MICO|nr:acyltransferase [Spelaeicoccus albus]NYI66324.1 peptidoglycan/LPS O-acetylase OafA/YrhL [Spelaeicoccus albus]
MELVSNPIPPSRTPRSRTRPTSAPESSALPARPSPAGSKPPRDISIDLVRAGSLIVVVFVHALMVGVTVGPNGLVTGNALSGVPWFAAVTWVLQVMPLFFIAGGFSAITSRRRLAAAGGTAGEFIRARLLRLLVPASVMIAVVGAALAVFGQLGVPARILADAGFHIGQPLWFLGVYIGYSALVPVMVWLHGRARLATPAVLLACALAVDIVRLGTGVELIGYLNLAFVWLFVQQLGFFVADDALARYSVRSRLFVAGAVLAALVTLTATGAYSANMIVNLNPPTICLALLGIVQLLVFSVVRHRIRTWAGAPPRRAVLSALGARAMTVYLWHMSAMLILVGAMALLRMPLPAPRSADWWLTRPAWLAAAALLTFAAVRVFGRFEKIPDAGKSPGTLRAATGAACGAAGIVVILVAGFTPSTAFVALTLVGFALMAVTPGARRSA